MYSITVYREPDSTSKVFYRAAGNFRDFRYQLVLTGINVPVSDHVLDL